MAERDPSGGRRGEDGRPEFRPDRDFAWEDEVLPASGYPPGAYADQGQKGSQRPDERIREDVGDLLMAHGDIDFAGIEVSAHEGEVVLRGTVGSPDVKRVAEETAYSVSGVQNVHNELEIAGLGVHQGAGPVRSGPGWGEDVEREPEG